ncbi:MAG: DUF3127 domain-containing protein [Bacteroidota bacterium]
MEITGKIVKIEPAQSGSSGERSWKKQNIVIETGGEYPKLLCMENWNDKVDISALQEGETLTAHINVESREYQGKWFTNVRVWKIEKQKDSPGGSLDEFGLPDMSFPDEEPPF